MRISMLFLCSFICLGNIYGQKEKVKGNKIVSTEEFNLEGFHTIEIYNNFEVSIDESSDNQVKVEADSNLQDLIQISVQDSVLLITSDKDLRRAKALNLDIFYASEVKRIIIYDKVQLKSLSAITSGELKVEVNDNADIFLTADIGKLECITNGKSSAEFHVTAKDVIYQVNDDSEIKGIVTSDSLKVDLYQKASSKLEGEVKSMLVRADNETDFYGEKLSAAKTSVIAEGSSDCYILTNETITVEARDKSEIFLLGEPKINIEVFLNEASLFKKNIDYVPSKLRLN
ncbi:GIN domain-containing protein [Aquimarina celericrescens]|uniref:GIN domain-containing protein n=1 Tax=Aquimarina celericrescens TaxID=1964542 RepID=A0ABW5AWC5_9FLAO